MEFHFNVEQWYYKDRSAPASPLRLSLFDTARTLYTHTNYIRIMRIYIYIYIYILYTYTHIYTHIHIVNVEMNRL